MEKSKSKGYKAYIRYLLISPSKVRRVARVINKKPYSEAIAILEALPQKGARLLKKAIISAASNAIYNNKKLDEDMLYVKALQVNDGPRMRRLLPKARGRADIIIKRMSHIFVEMGEITKSEVNSGSES
jgi:large subunit ribosomal protein L22